MRSVLTMTCVAGVLACASPADARTAKEAGLLVAQRRGHFAENAQCYADVFAIYAARNSRGRWVIPPSRGGQTVRSYRFELYRKCHIGA
ncbi:MULTISPECIES: hypothetical protein [unclassified Beijerinckia]|uniref:hypothetical protein n=1 Tax=unclassified Beijerinckia TaxID=2638183 RepID=UPI00089C91AD|nr:MULTISPECIES: hypothetical protein [unclassified Beijerinckia]MDH7799935.1 hypothetical protein [Beijerinckia sp. GAS462]SED43090.1 hypothetical protein SAMN05443249_5353 [Beijerinckia sp. 28-YEA-48]